MTVYTDYAYYTGTYLGNAITEADFPRLAMRASAIIDRITYGRAAYEMGNGTTPPNPDLDPLFPNQHDNLIPVAPDASTQDAIKMAVCAVAEEYQVLSKTEGGGAVASEHIGNNSVTYVSNSTLQLSDQAKLVNAARFYLATTGLLYKGMIHDDLWQSDNN